MQVEIRVRPSAKICLRPGASGPGTVILGLALGLDHRYRAWTHHNGNRERHMPDRKPHTSFQWRRSTFTGDFLLGATVEGWTDGSTWNGWAAPSFERDQAERLMELHRQALGEDAAWYDAEQDAFYFHLAGADEPSAYEGVDAEVDGQTVRIYAIGAGDWIWEEAE